MLIDNTCMYLNFTGGGGGGGRGLFPSQLFLFYSCVEKYVFSTARRNAARKKCTFFHGYNKSCKESERLEVCRYRFNCICISYMVHCAMFTTIMLLFISTGRDNRWSCYRCFSYLWWSDCLCKHYKNHQLLLLRLSFKKETCWLLASCHSNL